MAPAVTLEEVIDLAAPTVTHAEVVASRFRRPGPRRVRWGLGIAALAAAVVLVAIGAAALVALFAERDEVTPVTQPPEVVTTVPMPRQPADLVPTGVHDLSEGPHYDHVVGDRSGAIWAGGWGHIARIDVGSGEVRVWTAADDQVFEAGPQALAPARGGGVWLLGDSLRWFDGQRFRDVVEAPPQAGPGTGIVEAPDGSLFAASVGGVFRWDGLTWTEVAGGRPVAGAGALAMGPAGDLWVGNVEVTPDGRVGRGLSRFDGERWVTFTGEDAAVLAAHVHSIAALSDGTVWVGTDLGAAFYDGAEWVDHPVTEFGLDESVRVRGTRVAVGPDGIVWAATPVGDRGWVRVARFDGEAWSVDDSASGLSTAAVNSAVPVSMEAGVFVGTGAGLFQRVDDRWIQVLPPVGGAGFEEAPEPTPLPPSGVRAMKTSGGYLWAWGFDSIWRYSAGEWSTYSAAGYVIVGGSYVYDSDLAYAFDTVWRIRNDVGVVYLDNGEWQAVSGTPPEAMSISAAPDTGILWASDPEDLYRLDGREWTAVDRLLSSDSSSEVVAAGGGSVWTLRWNDWWAPGLPGRPRSSSLARYDDALGGWELVRPLGDVEDAIHTMTAAADGSLWVVLANWSEDWEEWVFRTEGEQLPARDEPLVEWVLALGTADGDEWTVYDQDLPDGLPVSLAADDDAVWLAMASGIAGLPDGGVFRFDGETWTEVATSNSTQVEVAPDGTVWALVDGTPQQLEP